jgi:hypothetical protein
MDKITINELKGYLGTGLQMQYRLSGVITLSESQKDEIRTVTLTNDNVVFCLKNCKPLLYPLSSLTEYREDLGFVAIDNIKESQRHLFFREDLENPINGLDYSEMQKLFDWHFDCFNLIDRNLAINIKTLKDE